MVSAEDREKIKELMRQGMTLDGATKQIQSDHLFAVNPKAPDSAKQTETPDTIKEDIKPTRDNIISPLAAVCSPTTVTPVDNVSPCTDAPEVLTPDQEADAFIDAIKPKIQEAVKDYNISIGVTDDYWRTKGKPQEFRGLCCYIGDTVFCDKKLLRNKPKHQTTINGYVYTNNNDEYNIPIITRLHDLFVRFCSSVGLPCKWGDFILFVNIPYSARMDIERRLTTADSELVQKAWIEQGESIAAAAEGSRIQPVVALARLNAFHGWTKQTEIYHATQAERKSTEQIAAEMGVIE